MADLEEAWLGGTKQMAMALPPDHPMFEIALRELGRCACFDFFFCVAAPWAQA